MKGLKPPVEIPPDHRSFKQWCLRALEFLTDEDQEMAGSWTFAQPPILPTYTVSTLPDVTEYARGMIYVSDETGGAVPAFSDGTNWRRVTDRAVVS